MAILKSKYTEDNFVPVKSIDNGMIFLDNGLKVSGVKIIPRNIFILDQESQDSTIARLKSVYDMIDYEFWLISADRPVDISLYLSNLEILYNNIQSTVKRKLIREDIDKANMFTTNNVVDTEYYLLFKEKDSVIVSKKIRDLISYFGSAGITTQQVSNDDLRVILDNFLNGGQTTKFGTVLGQ